MRNLVLILSLGILGMKQATATRIHVEAPTYIGKTALLYGYEDYFSLRTAVIAHGQVNDSGKVVLDIDVKNISLVKLTINHVTADFFIEPQRTYEIRFDDPAAGVAKTIGGNTKVNPVFLSLDRFDINALLTDMNTRIDAFIVAEYGKQKVADQQVVKAELVHSKEHLDTISVRLPSFPARIDTFETKVTNFYSEVDHPFFKEQLRYALAQLRIPKEHTRKLLFERYLKEQPIQYGSPEYVKFFKKFFHRYLLQYVYRKKPEELVTAIAQSDKAQLMALLQENDFLKDDELAELVLYLELYMEYANESFSKRGIKQILLTKRSDAIGMIGANCWAELSDMAAGSMFPTDIELWSPVNAISYNTDTLQKGYVYLAISASWCSYCAQETSAITALSKEYGKYVDFVLIGLDEEVDSYRDNQVMQPAGVEAFYAGADPLIFDKLRLRSLPAFYLLKDGVIIQAPAAPPSQGVGREFHRIKTAAQVGEKIKFWDD